ncbi:hypothetical protein GCM10027059_07050 [Myceligenerans halotolerans]
MSQHASKHPVAVGYAHDRSQYAEVRGYAASQGYALVQIVEDQYDAATISQITQHARDAHADVVILPGAALLSAARNRLEKELAHLNAACVVLGAPNSPARAAMERVMPRRDLDAVTRGRHTKDNLPIRATGDT